MKFGDTIEVTRADGAMRAGTAFWGCFPVGSGDKLVEDGTHDKHLMGFLAPCGFVYTAADFGEYLEAGVLPNYICMAEQLIATGELEL